MELKASFGNRVAARIYDAIIIGVPFAISMRLILGDYQHILGDILFYIYLTLVPFYFEGKTIGRKIMKIKIVDKNTEDTPSLFKLFIRNFLLLFISLFTFGLLYIVSSLFVVFREDKRALHDLIVGTAVIEDWD